MLNKKFYDDKIWALKYRPQTIDDIIISDPILNQLRSIIENKELSNMLFYGSAGIGKTTAAVVIANLLDRETMYINGSVETGIDVLRSKITQFVSTKSWDGDKKIVILDEADRGTGNLQDAWKSFLEEFSKTCNFIFISNHKNKIIPPLQSRLQTISFNVTAEEAKVLKGKFFKKCVEILTKENVEFDPKVVAHIVDKIYPDMRKILTELQKFAEQKSLKDFGIIKSVSADIETFFKALKERNFIKARKYVAQLTDPQRFYSELGQVNIDYIEPSSLIQFTILLNKYSYESAFVIDPQINIMAFIADCWSETIKVKDSV